MTIYEIFEDGILELPLEYIDGEQFRPFLFNKFNEFLIKVNQIDLSTYFPYKDRQRIGLIIDGICKSIELYYEGKPPQAYEEIKKSIDNSQLYSFLVSNPHPINSNVYRLRVKNENYHLSKKELFHIPFDKRHLINTQRYSIPGFPCIYVANSIYLAWEEMRRPELNNIQSVRLQNKIIINYLDLTTDVYSRGFDTKNMSENKLLEYLTAWPIIASCSVKVKEKEASFKPEYIIPQLLLQWIRSEKNEDAIKFSSTHIDLNNTQTKGVFYNFVIPVKTNCDNGHCSNLINMLESTEIVSWQLHQISSNTSGTNPAHVHMIKDVKTIEIIKGQPTCYVFSPLATLECQLNIMPEGKI